MDTDLKDYEYILSEFFSKLEKNNLPQDQEKLLHSIMNLHYAHTDLDIRMSKSLKELYEIIIYILRQYIKEGTATKEQKEILENLKNLATRQGESIQENFDIYEKASHSLINSLKNIGIK